VSPLPRPSGARLAYCTHLAYTQPTRQLPLTTNLHKTGQTYSCAPPCQSTSCPTFSHVIYACRCSSTWRSTRNRLAESCSACSMTWCHAPRRTFASSRRDSTGLATRKVPFIGSSLMYVFTIFLLLFGFFLFLVGPIADKTLCISSCCRAAISHDIMEQAGALSMVNVLTVRDTKTPGEFWPFGIHTVVM
jgi:hypothetical protein